MFNYPLNFEFKISTFSNDFIAKDANGVSIAYVRQKMFKLKEEVIVYSDESKAKELFHIRADKWLDFNTVYSFSAADSELALGKVGRKGWASLWKSRYELFDTNGDQDLLIQEENPWVKFWDGVCKEIPILNFFTGYFFNPSYAVTRPDGTLVGRFSKEKSFFGRRFKYEKLAEYEVGEELRVLLGLMMMVLLERRRG
ncbi:MAG: hypothetical protein H6579_06250 [Chitinophagales bacterium]|nr:hypothetical protein [Chitinophagales bacterium]